MLPQCRVFPVLPVKPPLWPLPLPPIPASQLGACKVTELGGLGQVQLCQKQACGLDKTLLSLTLGFPMGWTNSSSGSPSILLFRASKLLFSGATGMSACCVHALGCPPSPLAQNSSWVCKLFLCFMRGAHWAPEAIEIPVTQDTGREEKGLGKQDT